MGLRLLLVGLALLLAETGARADDPYQSARLSVGSGVGLRYLQGRSTVVPVEVSLTNMPLIPWSLSLGLVASGAGVDHAYAEVSVLSLGAGFGYGAYQAPNGRVAGPTFHLSAALPIPLLPRNWNAHDDEWLLYALPYYRPSWGPWPGTAHELGVMIKIGYLIERARCGMWLNCP